MGIVGAFSGIKINWSFFTYFFFLVQNHLLFQAIVVCFRFSFLYFFPFFWYVGNWRRESVFLYTKSFNSVNCFSWILISKSFGSVFVILWINGSSRCAEMMRSKVSGEENCCYIFHILTLALIFFPSYYFLGVIVGFLAFILLFLES